MAEVTIYYLEMRSPDLLKGKDLPAELGIAEVLENQADASRQLYHLVGKRWLWTDKLDWSDKQWREYTLSENLRTWVMSCKGKVAGYFELSREAADVEIIYFGLTGDFLDKGWGGSLLTEAIRAAWNWQGTKRVWVHTCTLDHPHALANYLARGMSLYKEEKEVFLKLYISGL